MFSTSKTRASVGRVLLVFCSLWKYEAQPADVVGGPFNEPEPGNGHTLGQVVNVCAKIDAANYPAALDLFRSRREGNTFTSIPLYDALTPEQRTELVKTLDVERPDGTRPIVIWAEWMPYQVGQAKKNDDDLGGIKESLAKQGELISAMASRIVQLEETVTALSTPAEPPPADACPSRIDAIDQRLAAIERAFPIKNPNAPRAEKPAAPVVG